MHVPSLACSWGRERGGTSNFGDAKSTITISNFFICGGERRASIFGQVNFAMKIFAIFLYFVQLLLLRLLGQSSEVECNPKMSISFLMIWVPFFVFWVTFVTQIAQSIIKS